LNNFWEAAVEIYAMAKFVTIFIILTIVLLVTPGCPPEQYGPDRSAKPNPAQSDPILANPANGEPNAPEPDAAETDSHPHVLIDPNIPEPNFLGLNKIEPKVTDVNTSEQRALAPNLTKTIPGISLHDDCNDIFTEFVNDRAMVDYKKLKRKRWQLRDLLKKFATLDQAEYNAWPREDKIAFWINAYNIRMLKVIADNYPIKSTRWRRLRSWWPATSIRHIDQAIGGIRMQKLIVMDEEFTLADIDRQIFTKRFDEPRVIFALSRASLDSPPLRNQAYYGNKLNRQLDEQMKKFLARKRTFDIDRKKKVVRLSAIFQPTVHGGKFLPKYHTNKKFKAQPPETRAVLNFLINYLPRENVSFLELENYTIEYIKYDWRLNDKTR